MTPQQNERYKRHILLPEIGEAGQQRLLDSRVLIVGAGGLGSPSIWQRQEADTSALPISTP